METIIFREVKITGEKSGKCLCGKRRVRRESFTQTINPWNVKKDGSPKGKYDILPELVAERDAWKKDPIYCEACRPKKS